MRFWQGYVLPRKFGIDKRYGNLSDLINSGQISRDQALEELENEGYPEDMQKSDRRYVIKKLGLTESEFDSLIAWPPKSFRDYPNSYARVERSKKWASELRRRGIYAR
jgi:hypothetical protein